MNSPFLHLPSLELETEKEPLQLSSDNVTESPFLANPRLNGKLEVEDPKVEQFVQIMDELYDEEFEEAIDSILNEAADLSESRLESDNYFTNEYQSQQLLHEYYVPLNREMDRFFNHMVHYGEEVDNRTKSLEELESFIDGYTYEKNHLTDVQENFLGGIKKLVRKATKAVKKGVSTVGKLAKKFGMGFFLKKLEKIAQRFLKGFLEKGINKLPGQYQALARGVAQKFLPKSVTGASSISTPKDQSKTQFSQEPAEAAQEELNTAVAHLLMANNEVEWEIVERELDNTNSFVPDQTDQLTNARLEFIGQLSELEEGTNPEPQVEQFVQAVIAGLKVVLPIIGRQRVINWLASLIAKLITKFVGKEAALALSKQMVETGFRMLNLEATPEDPAQVGTSAIVATVEDTVNQLEHFPAYVFEDRPLFERYVIQAFEQAAAANMPDILNESIYLKQPWLRESNRKRVLWKLVGFKRRSKNRRPRLKIKQLNEVVETELTPFIANEVRSYGGVSLATFLRDRMGVSINKSIPIRIHLFEALPGSHLHDLANYAKEISGIEASSLTSWAEFHPLTSVAAGLLIGEPGLGCRAGKCLHKNRNASGHRFYYVEIPGARPQFFAPQKGKPILRGITNLQIKLDFLANEIRLNLYLSEADAQAIAVNLRTNHSETAHLLVKMALEEELKTVFKYGQSGNLKILHTNVIPGKRSGLAINMLPPIIVNALVNAINRWVGKALISYLRNQPNQFVQAAEDYADGVTLSTTIVSPSDFSVLRQMLSGGGISIPDDLFSKAPAEVLFNAKPGYSRA